MRALTWHGIEDVRVTDVPDPVIADTTDAIVRVTSTAICGSDLHLYRVLAPYLQPGTSSATSSWASSRRSARTSPRWPWVTGSSCPSTSRADGAGCASAGSSRSARPPRTPRPGKGASLFGYTSLYGSVPGGQAEYVRVPHADFGPIVIPHELPDERFLYLSDILPTAWQAVEYADVSANDTLAVLGLGPVGQLAVRSALHRGVGRVIGVDLVPDRIEKARAHGAEVVDARRHRRRRCAHRDDGRPWTRRRDRRRGHGGARKPAVGEGDRSSQPPAQARRPRSRRDASASTAWPHCTPRSRPSAVAAPSRSAASTAALPTRCR